MLKIHNTPEKNEDFRKAWDATNERYKAFCKSLEKKQTEKEAKNAKN